MVYLQELLVDAPKGLYDAIVVKLEGSSFTSEVSQSLYVCQIHVSRIRRKKLTNYINVESCSSRSLKEHALGLLDQHCEVKEHIVL